MKLAGKIGKYFLIFLVVVNLAIIFSGRTYLYKGIANTYLKGRSSPSLQEFTLFSTRTIKAGKPQPWPDSKDYNKRKIAPDFLSKMMPLEPVAFLVVKNDSVCYEEYWDIGSSNSLTNSFSMAKSILAVLVGVAIKEGKIKSIDQPVSNYLPEFKNDKRSAITVKHLLTMSSGINFDEDYVNPLAYPAEAYYGDDLESLTMKYEARSEPGKIFRYLSGDSQLLAFVLKAATGKTVSDYATEKLWQPIGAENDALWALDHDNGWEKSFCCFHSNARDFARIGKLYMNYGNWKGNQLLDSSFVYAATHSTGTLEEDGTLCNKYGYQWWLLDYKGMHISYMRGILGQYVICIPDKNMIVVRLGKKRPKEKTPDGHPVDVINYIDAALSMYP